MLLLVVECKYDEVCEFLPFIFGDRVDQLTHPVRDVSPVFGDLSQRWTGESAAKRPLDSEPEGIVVGVEDLRVVGVERFVAGNVLGEKDGFVEPARVAQMPLGWTGVFDGLRYVIFRTERTTDLLGGSAYPQQVIFQLVSCISHPMPPKRRCVASSVGQYTR